MYTKDKISICRCIDHYESRTALLVVLNVLSKRSESSHVFCLSQDMDDISQHLWYAASYNCIPHTKGDEESDIDQQLFHISSKMMYKLHNAVFYHYEIAKAQEAIIGMKFLKNIIICNSAETEIYSQFFMERGMGYGLLDVKDGKLIALS